MKTTNRFFLWALLNMLLLSPFISHKSYAQVSTLTCNTPERMNPPAHSAMSQDNSGGALYALVGGVLNGDYAINTLTTDYASIGQVVTSLGAKWLQITDGAVPAAVGYPAGIFAGFEISVHSLAELTLFGDITISTYLNDTIKESVSGTGLIASLDLLSGGTRNIVGFRTTQNFNAVRITSSGVSVLAGEIRVYNAVFSRFCPGPALACNSPSRLTSPNFPLTIRHERTGLGGAVCIGCSLENTDRIINSTTSDFATLTLMAGVLANGSISVVDNLTDYPAGTYAGFDIASGSLLTAGVLSNFTLITYLDGLAAGDTFSGTDLLTTGSSVLSGTGRQLIGFVSQHAFDEVRLIASNTLSLSLGTLQIYGLVLTRFCSAPISDCNRLYYPRNDTTDPVYVNSARTGVDCPACAINNSTYAIDTIAANYAEIVLPVSLASTADFSVANALDTYPPGTFAGFDIELNAALSLSVLSTSTVKLYNNGGLVQTGAATSLLAGLSSTGLTGRARNIWGIVSDTTFDEVQISFSQLVGADLGAIRIYNLVVEPTCRPALFCNRTYVLGENKFPAVIDMGRTGVSGVASILAGVRDAWNVVSPDTGDYATITNTASVAAASSIAVYDPRTTYPSGTFAGFVVRMPSAPLVLLDLFNTITISTYNNGSWQESASGSDLINLTLLATLIGTPSSGAAYNVGFETTKPFDEIQITVSSLAGVSLPGSGLGSTIDIFRAFADTRRSDRDSSAMTCWITNPDINVGFVNMPVPGNLNTNDWLSSGATYGAALADVANPSPASPLILQDGVYSFLTATPGVYRFSVPVCPPAETLFPCPTELLTITVLDSAAGTKNPPVANTDIATTVYNTAVEVNTLHNDASGTPGASLRPSSVSIIDMNGAAPGNTRYGGSASVDLLSGKIMYSSATDFIGVDTLEYEVADDQVPPMSARAYQMFHVLPPDALNTTSAADDYKHAPQGVPIHSRLVLNDQDPEGDAQVVTADTITEADYSVVIHNDGTFTFSPGPSVLGSVSFAYQICDNRTTPACVRATSYVLVSPLSLPLPLDLVRFDLTVQQCQVYVRWEQGKADALRYYQLEYSKDGVYWQMISQTEASARAASYDFIHPVADKRQLFYRLKQVYDGQRVVYSSVKSVSTECSSGESVVLLPNPATDKLFLDIDRSMLDFPCTYTLSDCYGKVLLRSALHEERTLIDLQDISNGIYYLHIVRGDQTHSVRKVWVLK